MNDDAYLVFLIDELLQELARISYQLCAIDTVFVSNRKLIKFFEVKYDIDVFYHRHFDATI